MRFLSLATVVAFAASTDAGSAAPVAASLAPLAGATPIDTSAARADATDANATSVPAVVPAKLPRAPRKPKPVTVAATIKPEPKAAKPAPAATPAEPAVEPAPRVAPIARTCATIAAQATNFGGVLSDRDTAYIAFYASIARASRGGVVTIRAIADHGGRPNYNGSNKPHDAGIIVRLTKAGVLATEADGTSFTFTKHGRSLKAYAPAA